MAVNFTAKLDWLCQCPVNSVYTLPEAQTTLVKSSSYRRYRHPKRLSVAPACILALLLWVNVRIVPPVGNPGYISPQDCPLCPLCF